ncbi:MAG TPA: glycosyltransferase [Acidimicrobiales bacterium]|nr:glycosyltransferase [Acidimicrobiales bacterium]
MRKLAILSLHTSPLAQPGTGDGGGMNVYVRELGGALAQAGVETTIYTRKWSDDLAETVDVEPGLRVAHVEAGPVDLPKEALPEIVDDFAKGVELRLLDDGDVDAIHANYWLSGVAGHQLKHRLDLPLVSTFHTLARVKAQTGDPEPERRAHAEAEVVACSDAILANSEAERAQLIDFYGAPADRIEIVPPGVEHAFFSPGDQRGARSALDLDPDRPVVLFVGRIQPLKGLDVAIEAFARLERRDAQLVVVGGASGLQGEVEVARIRSLAASLGVTDRIRFVEPQPHHLLSTYYRAADLVFVPSRSESFGLVALEASACGVPVVASAVGGLLSLVDDGKNGFLVDGRDPAAFARHADSILGDPELAASLSVAGAQRARQYTWSTAAARLRRLYADLSTRSLVTCP